MSSPWTFAGSAPSLSSTEGVATLVEGQTFCVSGRGGDVAPDLPQGLFVLDTRVISQWELHVGGHRLEPLTVDLRAPFRARFVSRTPPAPGEPDSDVVVLRTRSIGEGMREEVVIRNVGMEPRTVHVELHCDSDLADLFAVKEGRPRPVSTRWHRCDDRTLRFGGDGGGAPREVVVRCQPTPSQVASCLVAWDLQLGAREERSLCMEVSVVLGGSELPARFRCGSDDADTVPDVRLAQWRRQVPAVRTDSASLDVAVRRSIEDLASLRIFDPEHPTLPVLAAGAPWFMTLFGRDSLLASWMSLLIAPELARGVLETLARLQGTDIDPRTEEEPGKILHEVRFGGATGLSLGGGAAYYGSVDATPLFVMLLGELRRWGLDDDVVTRLLPHADAAIEWIEQFGDRDGDGFVEYQRVTPEGLEHQGWRDSWDGVRFADGRYARPPIALCEVQAYVYAAYVARGHFAEEVGDLDLARSLFARADRLRAAFNERFWLPDRGWYALGLDADKQPVDSLTSNMGHCLWAGIVDPERARDVADALLSPAMATGWGVRTTASSMASYNPVSYHNGSVWPHDTALCVAGLVRYGLLDHAHRLMTGLLDAAAGTGGRLPELFAGFGRDEVSVPAPYPTSCSPQAWAAAAPLLLVREMLRFEPWASADRLWVAPALPPGIGRLTVEGIEVAGRSVTVRVVGDECEVDVSGPPGLVVAHEPRPFAGRRP
jgi:glycogen debranching enzyme